MTINWRNISMFAGMAALLLFVGFFQSWTLSLTIVNLCLISAIMALGVNIQWGYAGLLNVGVMGFAALGGLAAVLVSAPPVSGAWAAGGTGILILRCVLP
jgi:branched-chain amino acid transport system permease protein